MCGIAGFLGKREISERRIEECLQLMGRRGPNANNWLVETLETGEHLLLLHSRLSIIDLESRSDQPIVNAYGALSFNGEVYNYIELRDGLKRKGEEFTTLGDSEVLLRVLESSGINGLDVCEGMWAFAWYNKVERSLYLCRDRFGEKPLYYYENEDGVYFGSEPKFIFSLLGYQLEVNREHLRRYLVNGYKSLYKSNETFFLGLKEVESGSYRVYGSGEFMKEEKYWKPVFDCHDEAVSYEDSVKRVREELIRSMQLRMRSDVPIAFCLSGGIDSNALIAIAKEELDIDVHGFTIMNTDQRYEESDMVRIAVQEMNLRHTEVPIEKKGFKEDLRMLIKYHDAPVLTITYYAQWKLMKEIANNGYKVTVSGTGADEMFSGYYDHHNAYLADIHRFEDKESFENALDNWKTRVSPYVRNKYLKDSEYFIRSPDSRSHIYLEADIFASMLTRDFSEEFNEERYSKWLLRNRMANEMFSESVPVILHEDDLNAMYYSIENRSPFLDRSLFELMQTIPTRWLVRNGLVKALLRDAVADIAPREVITNPRKVGFNLPVSDYLNIGDKEERAFLLEESPVFDIVKKESLKGLLDDGVTENSRSKFLFNFTCAKIFLEEYS